MNSNSHNPSLLSFFSTLTQQSSRLQVRLASALLIRIGGEALSLEGPGEFIKGADCDSSWGVSPNVIRVIQAHRGQVCVPFKSRLLQKLFTECLQLRVCPTKTINTTQATWRPTHVNTYAAKLVKQSVSEPTDKERLCFLAQ